MKLTVLQISRFAGMMVGLGVAVANLTARDILLPNGSFESQPTQFADPRIDAWQKAPQPATFDTNQLGAWENLAGLFVNPPATNSEHLDNADGGQLAYIFNYPQMALFQDNNTVDWSGTTTHAFNAKFQAGKSYRLTAAMTTSKEQPLGEGAMFQLSLYYRDAASNRVTVASTNITYDTNLFANLTHLVGFELTTPEVKASDAWAGQNIGVELQPIINDPNLIGGVWDVDNVRLAEEIPVPNFSFESPVTQFVDPRIDSWQKAPQPATFDTNTFGAWDNLSGLFINPPSTNSEHIDNAQGNQLVFLFAYPQAGLMQDFNSTDWSGTASHAFTAKFEPGKSYRLMVGLTTSKEAPLSQGSTLLLSFYYRDAASNVVTIASTNVTFDTNLFANITHLLDFSVVTPEVSSTDAWAGKNIGIAFQSTVAPNLIGGVWDLDNVRLGEVSGATLGNLSYKNGQAILTVNSDAGSKFEILASNDLGLPIAQWQSVGVVNNLEGSSTFTEIGQNSPHRFYRARLVP
jgi:hypothetical protein